MEKEQKNQEQLTVANYVKPLTLNLKKYLSYINQITKVSYQKDYIPISTKNDVDGSSGGIYYDYCIWVETESDTYTIRFVTDKNYNYKRTAEFHLKHSNCLELQVDNWQLDLLKIAKRFLNYYNEWDVINPKSLVVIYDGFNVK